MRAVQCPVCNGTGRYTPPPSWGEKTPDDKLCHGCAGKGWVEVHEDYPNPNYYPPNYYPGYPYYYPYYYLPVYPYPEYSYFHPAYPHHPSSTFDSNP